MKKYVVVLCALMLLLTACGTKGSAPTDSAAKETAAQESSASEPTETPAPETTVPETPAPETSAPEPPAPEPPAPEAAVNPEDYLGMYTDNANDQVKIEKNGDAYWMVVTIYRLTTLDGEDVSFTDEGVVFDTIDAAGKPIKLLFYKTGEGVYALKILESTWALRPGEVFDNFTLSPSACSRGVGSA